MVRIRITAALWLAGLAAVLVRPLVGSPKVGVNEAHGDLEEARRALDHAREVQAEQ